MPRTSSEALLRPDLGCLAFEYSMSAASQGFIGRQVLPPFSTALQSSVYPVIEAGTFLELAETERAARAAYARGDWQFGDDHYFCKENGWEEPVDDQEAALFKNYFDAEVVAVKRATLMVLRSQERRVAHKVMDTAKITNAPVAKAWNDYANADPLADVVKAKEAFRYTVGLKPNALVLDEDVLRLVSMCAAVMERVKYPCDGHGQCGRSSERNHRYRKRRPHAPLHCARHKGRRRAGCLAAEGECDLGV